MCFAPPKMGDTSNPNQKPKLTTGSLDPAADDSNTLLNERVLLLVFNSLKWDLRSLCQTSAVSRKLRALARRLLWRELCLYRAPRMTAHLSQAAEPNNNRLIGGWHALAKLLFFCGGCESTHHFKLTRPAPGHFVKTTRFSKTSGRSFLAKNCRGDVLHVSDPCEHSIRGSGGECKDDVVGIYRGVFSGFMRSRTRDVLIRRGVEFESGVRCPYCGARIWSMTAARLIARRSAARRLGSSDNALEYFVCLNGHLHGACWLVPLSSDEGGTDGEDDEEDDDEGSDGGGPSNCHGQVSNGRV